MEKTHATEGNVEKGGITEKRPNADPEAAENKKPRSSETLVEESEPGSSRKSTTKQFFEKGKTEVSASKHKILRQYMGGWLAIFGQTEYGFSNIVYVDGFAGPGIYSDQQDGSPAVIFKLAVSHKRIKFHNIYLLFIEKDKDSCKQLLENLKKLQRDHKDAVNAERLQFMVINGLFVQGMEWILSKAFKFQENHDQPFTVPICDENDELLPEKQFIDSKTPFFVFADPFGFKGGEMPMTLMKEIMSRSTKSEVLINIMTGSITRFWKLDNRTRPINLLIGDDENDAQWKPIVLAEPDKHEKLIKFLDFYHENISENLKESYSSLFEMRSAKNKLVYNLYFVSQNVKGFDTMKRAMGSVSQSAMEFKFSSFKANDPRFTRECVEIERLEQDIIKKFGQNDTTVTGKEITAFINTYPTLYMKYRKQLKVSLRKYATPKGDGKRNRKKFDDIIYNFYRKSNKNL